MKKKGKFEPGVFDLRVKRSRTGLGLFTLDSIQKGECIIEYKGRRLTKKQEEETVECLRSEKSGRLGVNRVTGGGTKRRVFNRR